MTGRTGISENERGPRGREERWAQQGYSESFMGGRVGQESRGEKMERTEDRMGFCRWEGWVVDVIAL